MEYLNLANNLNLKFAHIVIIEATGNQLVLILFSRDKSKIVSNSSEIVFVRLLVFIISG